MALVQSNGSQDLYIKTVWYAGTQKLSQGQVVVYDNDDTLAPLVPVAGDLSASSRRNLRGNRVVDPVSTIKAGFAGLLYVGMTAVGPAFIDLVVPRKGDIVPVSTKVNATKNSTVLIVDSIGGTNNLIADGTDAVGSATTSTKVFDQVAIAYQTTDTSTTAAVTLARFI